MTTLKDNELKVLHRLLLNQNLSFQEIARGSGMTEGSVRRICNRLKQEGVYREINVPNFAMLGFEVMMVQTIKVASSRTRDIPLLVRAIKEHWRNCIDCAETFDGKMIVRSVWKNADEFKNARTCLHQELGTDWLLHEETDMVPLDRTKEHIRIMSPFKEEQIADKS